MATSEKNINVQCNCNPHKSHFFKKLVIFVLGAIVGFAVCYCTCVHRHGKAHKPFIITQEMFVDNCLDTAQIKNPKMADKVKTADADGDGCIAWEEFTEWKEAIKQKFAEKRAERMEKHEAKKDGGKHHGKKKPGDKKPAAPANPQSADSK
ncbi:MAG: hypothetical protein LBJ18_00065 [Rickettsiales bacterium]|jgi:hypothetical protein|nr:hypothetical protein [Rickettsiales bacterium]